MGFLASVKNVGAGGLVYIEPLSAPTDPGYGQGHPFPDRPDAGLPWGPGHPGNALPGWERPVDPGYGQGGINYPGNRPPGSWGGRPDNSLPVPPVKPSPPIVLPPGTWPPQLPPGANVPDNSLPPVPPGGVARPPIHIPIDPDLGIEQPIVLPELPPGVAILIALPTATPKAGTPPNTQPAILVQSGKKPMLVYVTATATPK